MKTVSRKRIFYTVARKHRLVAYVQPRELLTVETEDARAKSSGTARVIED